MLLLHRLCDVLDYRQLNIKTLIYLIYLHYIEVIELRFHTERFRLSIYRCFAEIRGPPCVVELAVHHLNIEIDHNTQYTC
jgi:hypothetical protein